METLKTLIRIDAVLLALFAGLEAFGTRNSRASEDDPALSLLGTGLLICAVLLLLVGDLLLVGGQRRLGRYLAAGNVAFSFMVMISGSGQYSTDVILVLVLVSMLMAGALFWASLLPLRPEEAAAELSDLRIPDEVRQALLRQVGESAAQEERNRLARDLHDSVKQQLFTINVGAATAQERWDRDPEGARTALADVRRAAREAMAEMQAMLHQLRPQALTSTTGLVEALREQAEALGYRSGARVTVELGPEIPDDRLPPGAREALFRIAQEALANVARHARAENVQIWIGQDGEEAVLRVEDDGQGFDPRAAVSGMGLRNLHERAAALRGRVDIESAPGAGSRIIACLPLAPIQQRPETSLERAINLERGTLWIPLIVAVLFFSFRPFLEGSRTGPFLVVLLAFLWACTNLYSRRTAAPSKLAEDPAALSYLRAASHRLQALLLLVISWWVPWYRHLSEEGWTVERLAWACAALLLLGISGYELVRFHRYSEPRPGLPGFRWRSSDLFPTCLVTVYLMGAIRKAMLRPLLPVEIFFLFLGAAATLYFIFRQPRKEGAPA